MNKSIYIILLLTLTLTGCQGLMFTTTALVVGTDTKPNRTFLLKGEHQVAVVPRSTYSNSSDLQNAPREIARLVNNQLDEKIRRNERLNYRNKKLTLVDQKKVEAWLDDRNNDFDSFVEVGKDKTIKADIVIGIDIIWFQIRDSRNPSLIQGNCQVQVQAVEVATGKVLSTDTITVTDPLNAPISGGTNLEAQFRPQFVRVVAERIAALYHYYDKQKLDRMDADSIGMHRF